MQAIATKALVMLFTGLVGGLLAHDKGEVQVAVSHDGDLPDWLKGQELRATYSGGIALIYQYRCVPCHRPGEVAPMSFGTYNDIRQWTGRTNTPLESLIQTRAMPPWPADPGIGKFSNSLYLTDRELDLLLEWIRRGLPRGEGSPPLGRDWVEGWNIGKPDHVFDLPRTTLIADTEKELREYVIETNFTDARWIVAAEVRPGNESVVMRIDAGPLGAYHPGNSYLTHSPGTGFLLQPGQKIPVLIHYEKSAGSAITDQSRIGVIWAKRSVAPPRNVIVDRMKASDFTIPAGEANFEVTARFEFPSDAEIVALMPIMNLRGKDVRYRIIQSDGSEDPLLAIPAWDPNWKYRYQLASPVNVTRGTILEATAHFDNSEGNLRNPDPTVAVNSGADTELFEGWVSYVLRTSP